MIELELVNEVLSHVSIQVKDGFLDTLYIYIYI